MIYLAGHALATLLIGLVPAVVVSVALLLLGNEEAGPFLSSRHLTLVVLHKWLSKV